MLRSSLPGKHLLLLCVSVAAIAGAENYETPVERSHHLAQAVVDRASQAAGGTRTIQAIKAVRVRREGQSWPRLQMPTPAPPYEAGTHSEVLVIDLDGNRMQLEERSELAGIENHESVVLTPDGGVSLDHRARTATPIPAAQTSQQEFIRFHRRLPQLLLRQAYERAHTLRHLGTGDIDGRRHDVITFVMADAQQVALYVSRDTGLVSKYELTYFDGLTGEDANEIFFGDYVRDGIHASPRSWTNLEAGEVVAKFQLQVEFNPAIPDTMFQLDRTGYERVDPMPDTLAPRVESLADGVYVLQNVAGQNQNVLVVGFSDHVVVVEAPGTSRGSEAVIQRIGELLPGKPIRYLALTHHHGDHIGGARSYIAEGATIVTTAGNQALLKAQASATQNDRLWRHPREPKFILLEGGRHILKDDTQHLELIDIGPNPHAREMVIAWLPRDSIVFQGDLYYLRANRAPHGPPQATTVAFARALREMRLPVKRIAGVHGLTASIDEFQAAITKK